MQAKSNLARKSPRALRAVMIQSVTEIREAQALRYRVFTAEYGAQLRHGESGLDQDEFDPLCAHLCVVDDESGAIIATTRILTSENAARIGRFYSESEFDLLRIRALPGRFMEIGRTCVDPAYRNGGAMAVLWAGIAQMLVEHQYDYLIGCASISMNDGGVHAWKVTETLRQQHLAAADRQVTPRRALPHLTNAVLRDDEKVDVPALIKAYLRLGAKVCGEPCWDPEFRCADLFILLEVASMSERYARHFFKR